MHLRLITVCMLLSVVLHAAAKDFYAVLSNGTVTFYYDDNKVSRGGEDIYSTTPRFYDEATKAVMDASMADYAPSFMTTWFYGCSALTSIEGMEYLNTSEVLQMNGLFQGCSSLTSLDLTGFDTSNVTTMNGMFAGCSSLTELDLSSFNTSKVKDMGGIFAECSNLKTVYVDENKWSTAAVANENGGNMALFYGCGPLVGGNGTKFSDTNKEDLDYARVDKAGQPGYLTHKAGPAVATAEPYAVLSNDNTVLTFYYDNKKESRGGGLSIGPFNYVTSWNDYKKKITTVVFDNSFADYTELTSTYYWFAFCENLTTVKGIENLKTDNVTDMYAMFWQCKSLNSLDISGFKTDNVTNFNNTFAGCSSLTVLDVGHFNTEKVTNMHCMFSDCSGLTSLDVSHFKTDNVVYMGGLFGGCSSLTSIDISKFNTEKVTDMSYMFRNCSGLKKLDVTNLNTEKVTDMYFMFSGCSGLKSLDLSNFNTANVTNMGFMFSDCTNLETIYVGKEWSTAKVTSDMYNDKRLFSQCSKIVGGAGTVYSADHTDYSYARIDGGAENPGYFTAKNATTTPSADAEPYVVLSDNKVLTFYYDNQRAARGGSDIKARVTYNATYKSYSTATTASFDASFAKYRPTSTALWFCECSSLTAIEGMQYLNTDNVTDMHRMFDGCSSLTSLDVSGFNTEKVTSMGWMFADCSNLTSLDVSGFKTDNVTDMRQVFYNCSGLKSLDVNNFNTANVTWMSDMFDGCSGLTSLDLSGFKTDKVTDMRFMFYRCSSLATIYTGNDWTTKSVTEGGEMFSGCPKLVGGAGTTYSADHIGHTYAHIDGGADNPGYFTDKNATPTPSADAEPYAVLSDNDDEITIDDRGTIKGKTLTFFYDNQKESRGGMSVVFTDSPRWTGYCYEITKAVFDGSFANCTTLTCTYRWFCFCSNLKTITGITNLKTDNVTDMRSMFYGCSSLTSLDLSSLNTSSLKKIYGMFQECSGLKSINLTNFITDNVEDMGQLFLNCSSLESLDLSGFKTDGVSSMWNMFYGCSSLKSLDLSNFNTKKVRNMVQMFRDCSNLTTIFVGSNWSTEAVTQSTRMFEGCTSLVGGAGTAFDANHTDYTYARVDGGADNPGYLTSIDAKGDVVDFTNSKGWTFEGNLSTGEATLVSVNKDTEGETIVPETVINGGNAYTVTALRKDAFKDCSKIEKITIAKSIKDIECPAFTGCSSLKAFDVVQESAGKLSAVDGVLYSAVGTNDECLIAYPAAKASEFEIPASVKAIASGAFANAKLTSLTVNFAEPLDIPADVFEGMDFDNCVLNVPLGTSSKYREHKVWGQFKNISGEKEVTVDDAVYQLDEDGTVTFVGVDKSKAVGDYVVPETIKVDNVEVAVKEIAPNAFENCTGLVSVTIPANIQIIGDAAFKGCTGLEEIYCLSAVPIDLSKVFASRTRVMLTRSGEVITQFEGIDFETCILYVPAGSKKLYEQAEGWKQFKNIVEMGETTAITIGKSGKASYCGDKSLDFSFSDEVKAYIATGFDKDEGTIWLTRVKDVPAGVPVLIKGDANKTYDVPVTDSQNSYYTNMFVGNTSGEKIQIQETDGDMVNYYLSGDGTFKSVNKTANIGTNKCYLQLPGTFEAAVTGATQTVKVGSIGKASFAAPVDLNFTNVSGLKAFTATGYDKSTKTIWLTRVMKVQKGEGVLLKGDPNSYEIPSATVQSSYENMFVGNTSGNEIQVLETSEDGSLTNYYLSGKDGSFVSVNGFAKIGNNKCYLALPTSMVAVSSTRSAEDDYKFEEPEVIKLPINFRSIESDGDGTTSIKDITPALSEGEGAWYTLQGQRVAKPGKGVYIKNGKKVVIK